MTQSEIGMRLGISKQRVQQIEEQAMRKLAKICKDMGKEEELKDYLSFLYYTNKVDLVQ